MEHALDSVRATVEALVSRMLDRRNLPGYRLEPRFDPFVAHFLVRAVGAIRGEVLIDFVLPELPLQRKMLYGESAASPNKSTKVDFALFRQDRSRVILVELKTDIDSRGDAQDKYLVLAKESGWRKIVDGILAISRATDDNYVSKYDILLQAIARLGYIEYSSPSTGSLVAAYRAAMDAARATTLADHAEVEVLFVQPTGAGPGIISFDQLAGVIRSIDDPFAHIVATALVRLVTPAGASAEALLEQLK